MNMNKCITLRNNLNKLYLLVEFLSPPRLDRLWGPSSLVSNGYRRLFPRR